MARPQKVRSVQNKPYCSRFKPENLGQEERIILSLDEYETIRWIDHERLSQENCALRMDISRTTVQRMYASAREKLAKALVHGHIIEIEGGSIHMDLEKNQTTQMKDRIRLAIGLDGNQVASHFGQCNDYRLVDIENNRVVQTQDLHDEVSIHQQRPQFLKDQNVDVLVINGLGKGAYNRLLALDIQCLDAQGQNVDVVIDAYLSASLNQEIQAHECSGCKGHHHHG